MASAAPPSSQAAAALSLASSLGLSLRADWLEAAARAAAARTAGGTSSSSSAPTTTLTAEALFSLVLNADLNSAGAGGSLPGDLESLHGRALPGRRILQVDEVVNAAASAKHRYSGAPVSGRMLKLLLTDGSSHVVAFELEPVPALSADLPAGCKIAVTEPLVLRGMLALRPANVAVLGGCAQRLEAAKGRARAEWGRAPDGRSGGGGRAGAGGGGTAGAPTLYEKARAAAWPGAGAAAAAGAPAAPAPPLAAAAPPPPLPPPPPQQQQQQNQPPLAAPAPAAPPPPPPPPTVIVLDSSDDEDVKMEAVDGGDREEEQREEQQRQQQQPSFFPLPAAAGPAPTSLPRCPLLEAAAAAAAVATAATSSGSCLVRARVVGATSALRFMDPGTGLALAEFGLDVELEESDAGARGGSGRGESGGSGGGCGGEEEEEGFAALASPRVPASLSHPLISGLLGGISPGDLVREYTSQEQGGGREALVAKLGAAKAFFDAFDGWLAVGRGGGPLTATALTAKTTERERESGEGGSSVAPSSPSPSLVVVGWWEA